MRERMKENKVGYKDAFASKKWLRVRVKQIMGSMRAVCSMRASCILGMRTRTNSIYILLQTLSKDF